jgi:hypothetical protein
MHDNATVHTGSHDAGSPALQTGSVISAATKPFGVRVAYTDTSTTGIEWFPTLVARAQWIARTPNITVERRPLVRISDGDEHGTFLGRREVVCLAALADHARDATRQAAREHAGCRTLIAAVELRAVWPGATEIVADLAGPLARESDPTIEEIRDGTGTVLWTLDDGPEADAVDRAEEQLGNALDYLDEDTAGWEPLSDAELTAWAGDTRALSAALGNYYRLTLPT